jgi:hypothetical protein
MEVAKAQKLGSRAEGKKFKNESTRILMPVCLKGLQRSVQCMNYS